MNQQKCASLHVDQLLDELAISAEEEISLRHPMAFGEVIGHDQVKALVAAIEGIFSNIEPSHAWSSTDISGHEWHGHFQGRLIRGVTVAWRLGKRIQIDIFLSSFPALARQALHDASKHLINAEAWLLPPGVDVTLPPIPANEVLSANLPFNLSADIILTSPVACKPVRGIADVEQLCAHSVIVYGGRANGPRLTAGATTLSLWTGSVAGLPLEVANVIHWEDSQHVKIMAMAMRPWPVVALFKARMQARTRSFLDTSYFELEE